MLNKSFTVHLSQVLEPVNHRSFRSDPSITLEIAAFIPLDLEGVPFGPLTESCPAEAAAVPP
jgi:hypothetical protein